MATRINRRDFMATTAAAGLAAAARPLAASGSSGPTVIVQGSIKPVVISSANGHRFKNGGP
ncbi:MAG TPA: twin-arginine translocation signal domain-containing protein, partial [Vicinamibacterales bacterium]